jgi:hypothetical protein
MKAIGISRIEIDDSGRLLVYPAAQDSALFQLVYRAGAEVYWDAMGYFYSPVPREWSYASWLKQIRSAALGELGIQLGAMENTEFVSVSQSDEQAMRLELAQQA